MIWVLECFEGLWMLVGFVGLGAWGICVRVGFGGVGALLACGFWWR